MVAMLRLVAMVFFSSLAGAGGAAPVAAVTLAPTVAPTPVPTTAPTAAPTVDVKAALKAIKAKEAEAPTCFPGESMTSAGRIDELEAGVQVLVGDVNEPVMGFIHVHSLDTGASFRAGGSIS